MMYIILEKSKKELEEDQEKDQEESPEEQTEGKVDVGNVILVPDTKKKAEVTAVGKDGVTARDDKGNKFQMVHENVKTKDGKEPKGDKGGKVEEQKKPEETKDGDSIDSKLPKEKKGKEGKKPPKDKDEKEEDKEDGKSEKQKVKALDSKLEKKKDKKPKKGEVEKEEKKEIKKAEYYTTIDEEFEKARTKGAKDKQKRRARATSTELHRKDLESENWHTRTMARMKGLPVESLHFIIKDATEAAENAEHMGNPKAGQYRDEVHYAHMELKRRQGVEKSYVVSIDEEFEKSRTKGAKDKKKRKTGEWDKPDYSGYSSYKKWKANKEKKEKKRIRTSEKVYDARRKTRWADLWKKSLQ
jgi:hypothetical protein